MFELRFRKDTVCLYLAAREGCRLLIAGGFLFLKKYWFRLFYFMMTHFENTKIHLIIP